LQNITIDNTRTFASIVFVNLIMSTSIHTLFVNVVLELNILVVIFSSILHCYLNNIFYNKLNVKNIIRFIVDLFFVATTNAIDFSNARNLLNLLYIFDIYVFIALSFVLYLTIK